LPYISFRTRERTTSAAQKSQRDTVFVSAKKTTFQYNWAKDGFVIHADGKIELSMGIHNGRWEKPIVIRTRNLPEGEIKEMELCYEKELYLSVTYEDGTTADPYQQQRAVGVDPGRFIPLPPFVKKAMQS
jgi:putative transposase